MKSEEFASAIHPVICHSVLLLFFIVLIDERSLPFGGGQGWGEGPLLVYFALIHYADSLALADWQRAFGNETYTRFQKYLVTQFVTNIL